MIGRRADKKKGREIPFGHWLEPLSVWRWTTLSPIVAVTFVFIITIFDPFGFESVTKLQSANIFYKWISAAYPADQRDNISVVLLDDETLKDRPEEPWPPSHLVHGDVLDAILSYQPALVLVDIFFLRQGVNDHFGRTKDVIEHAQDQVKLFLVAADRLSSIPPARPEIMALANQKKIVLVSGHIDGNAIEAPIYPLHKEDKYEPAALAVYHWICEDPTRPKLKTAKCSQDEVPGSNPDGMEVVWGLNPAPYNCQRAEKTEGSRLQHVCNDLFYTIISRPIQLLWEALIPRNYRSFDPLRIPYHAVISTKDLLDGGKHEDMRRLLKGKVVIYGARLSLVKDFVFSPVHGQIDGAFFHAMALDNLLTYGSRYVQQPAGNQTFRKEWIEFQPAIVMIFASFAVYLNRRHLLRHLPRTTAPDVGAHRLHEEDERFMRKLRWFLLFIAIAGLGEFFFSISPFNWMALIIVVHATHRIDKRFFQPRTLAK
jgi:CHASE2 domain-containing sensor protein